PTIERAEELSRLIAWCEARDALVSDPERQKYFGALFRGLDADIEQIARLNTWYVDSHAILVGCPGLTEKVDLTTLAADRISELASRSADVRVSVERLVSLQATVRSILGADIARFRDSLLLGWGQALAHLAKVVEGFNTVLGFFTPRVNRNLSPKDALRL
ncbi:superfamily I DNA/RNA helicase, partial [mine drainage metagenome]